MLNNASCLHIGADFFRSERQFFVILFYNIFDKYVIRVHYELSDIPQEALWKSAIIILTASFV